MTDAVLVSAIIPCYNQGQYAREAVQSVMSQTIGDIECLVIDDGSIEESQTILSELPAEFGDRCKVLTHPNGENRGVAASRNLGIDLAKGDYIAFLDADDAWLPEKLELQIDALQKSNDHIGMVFSDFYICDSPDPLIPMTAQSLQRNPFFSKISKMFQGEKTSTLKTLLFHPPERMFNWVQSPTPLIKRDYFDLGLRFIGPPRLSVQYEDYLMWLMLSFHCEFIALSDPLAIYRIHKDQLISRFHHKNHRIKYLKGHEEIIECLKDSFAGEIQRLGINKKIDERLGNMAIGAVEHAERKELIYILQLSFRKRFLYRFCKAYLVRILRKCHYYIRSIWIFNEIQPLLKTIKNFLHSLRTGKK